MLLEILFAILFVCLSHVMWSFIVTPKKLNSVTLSMTLPFITSEGISFGFIFFCLLWNIINLVFCTFKESLLTESHSNIFDSYIFISFDKVDGSALFINIFSGLDNVVSSAYKMKLNVLLAVGKSFIYIMNKSGPRIDPWGTPVCMLRRDDDVPLMSTYCSRFVR